jgi:hypothetical protein
VADAGILATGGRRGTPVCCTLIVRSLYSSNICGVTAKTLVPMSSSQRERPYSHYHGQCRTLAL